MPRPRGKELSPNLRTRICEAKALGLTYPQIVARYHVTLSAAKYTVAKERARGTENASRPRSGRPRIIDEPTRDLLVGTAYHGEDSRIKWRDLTIIAQDESGFSIHQRSVQRLFS